MVLDILDALAHPAHYDEFVVASADADFTPVMLRLRAHDRLTTIVTAGPTAAAYLSVCDVVILPDELASAVHPSDRIASVLGGGAKQPGHMAPEAPQAQASSDDERVSLQDAEVSRIKAAILAAVRAADRPLVTASAAQAALAVDPMLSETGWGGAGKFSHFIARHVPELRYAPRPSPGYLFDPARHSHVDVPAGHGEPARTQLSSIPAQVSLVTNAPPLTSEQYAVLFEELATEVNERGFDNGTVKNVRDRAHIREQPIGRGAVGFVVQGLTYAGLRPRPGQSAHDLATAWLTWLREVISTAQMQLSEEDITQVRQWIMGALPDAPQT
jgi:hypothetical protein